jgi:hypothetical protein
MRARFVGLTLDAEKTDHHKLATRDYASFRVWRFASFLPRYAFASGIGQPMADFIPNTPDWFQTRRAAQVVAFFGLKAGGVINILRATKLVYLADRLSMERRDYSITGDNFVSMPFGPVNTNTYDYMNGRGSNKQDEWQKFISKRVNHDLPVTKGITFADLDELSKSDFAVLEETWTKFSDIEKYELAEWTHKFCPEWQNPGKSSIPIDFSTVYKKLGKPNPADIAEEIQAERKLILDLLSR